MSILNQTRPTTQLSPAQISAMLAQRRERARNERENYGLLRQGNGVWSVVSRDGKTVYETTQFACTCPDFNRWGKEISACKHVFLVRSEEERLAEEQARKPKRDTRADDYGPFDEYDRKPSRSLIHPLEDEQAYEAWLSTLAESGDVFPAD